MSTYIVSFEVAAGPAKEKLENKLKSFGGYCPINKNCWAITSSNTAIEICNILKLEVGASDRILVMRSGTESAWINTYGEDYSKWLKNNL